MVIAILKSQEGQEHTSLLQLLGQDKTELANLGKTNPNKILTLFFYFLCFSTSFD